MKNKWLIATVAAFVTCATAQAVQIVGSIDIVASGSSVVLDKTANTVTFIDDNLVQPGNSLVSNAVGDFVPFEGQRATYQNFTYSPLSVVNPLWTLVSGSASFDLTSITYINELGSGLSLIGIGTIHMAGKDSTAGTWSFSADTANQGGRFTFSSQTAAGVPDGGTTVMLLGGAFTGLGLLRRKLVA